RQRGPGPGMHNSGWVQSPGAEVLADPSRQTELEGYVSGVIGRFRDDARVLAWDLFNEADSPNPVYRDAELADKAERATELLTKLYPWSRAAGPSQPITAGIYGSEWGDLDRASDIRRLMLTESDVISFHSYQPADALRAHIDALESYGRPILPLTEYLARGAGSTFQDALPLLRERNVGAYNWGLVSGKTQTIYPWDSWVKQYESEPEPWFHDVFRPDGTPYREDEVALIRRLTCR
ncbi:MAG: 1,4-beta-xylanase, partial [Chloroflexi bacterium]|nr:1,4-beta-xylanase [Chloroflexota bacterium]